MRGIGEERAGEGDELALAEREAAPALGDLGLVAVLELEDELVRPDGARGGRDLLVGLASGRAEEDVLAHGAREEEALLRDDAELAPQALLRDLA